MLGILCGTIRYKVRSICCNEQEKKHFQQKPNQMQICNIEATTVFFIQYFHMLHIIYYMPQNKNMNIVHSEKKRRIIIVVLLETLFFLFYHLYVHFMFVTLCHMYMHLNTIMMFYIYAINESQITEICIEKTGWGTKTKFIRFTGIDQVQQKNM